MLSANNHYQIKGINNFISSLEQIEMIEQIKINKLQKILLITNRKTIKNATLRIGNMIAQRN
jgi:hypothetical protein